MKKNIMSSISSSFGSSLVQRAASTSMKSCSYFSGKHSELKYSLHIERIENLNDDWSSKTHIVPYTIHAYYVHILQIKYGIIAPDEIQFNCYRQMKKIDFNFKIKPIYSNYRCNRYRYIRSKLPTAHDYMRYETNQVLGWESFYSEYHNK